MMIRHEAPTTIDIPGSELVLGDAVLLLDTPYGWGTVVSLKDGIVSIFRPFVHIADFEYTGGVLHYVGTEMIRDCVSTSRVFTVDAYTHREMSKEGALR